MPYAGYYDSIKAQRKLLEYLIKLAKAWPRNEHGDYYIRVAELKSMLKEASQ